MMLSNIAHKQTKATKATDLSVMHLLDYCTTHPNAKIHFCASNMILKIHSDASYLNALEACSHIRGSFFPLFATPK